MKSDKSIFFKYLRISVMVLFSIQLLFISQTYGQNGFPKDEQILEKLAKTAEIWRQEKQESLMILLRKEVIINIEEKALNILIEMTMEQIFLNEDVITEKAPTSKEVLELSGYFLTNTLDTLLIAQSLREDFTSKDVIEIQIGTEFVEKATALGFLFACHIPPCDLKFWCPNCF